MMSRTATTLYVRYKGWAVVRIPTDPDPSDEPNGASGYTFAFAGEPRLDRIFRLQPEPRYIRPGPGYGDHTSWPWGVFVFDAEVGFTVGPRDKVPGLVGASVDMLGDPKLENRNWLLTYPGWEPFVPYRLAVTCDGVHIERDAPLDPNNTPYWKLPTATLMNQAARGAYIDHEAIGTATGIWDATALYQHRQTWLKAAIGEERDPVKLQALQSRLYEVEGGLAVPDNRVGAHYAVERFDFPMTGSDAITTCSPTAGFGALDANAAWTSSFFFGCFDADLLGVFVQGVLQIPFQTGG